MSSVLEKSPYFNMLKLLAATALAASLLFAAPLASPAEAKPVVKAFSVEVSDNRSRFTADISDNLGYAATILPDPYRVVIEVPGAGFDLPAGALRKTGGLVKQIRYGKSDKGIPQILLDTTGPVLIEKSEAVARKGKSPAQIVIDLVETTPEVFAAAYAIDNVDQLAPLAASEASTSEVTASLPVIMPKKAIAKSATKPGGKPVIVIDPGHGGIDGGALSPRKIKEKDVVLAFALELQKSLVATNKFDVRMTRSDDSFVSLKNRVKFAREQQASLFIAIHADTVRGQTATGTTVYTLSEKASDAESAALAQKENKVDLIAGLDFAQENEDVADILIDLVQRESKNHALLFSKKALEQLKGTTTLTGKPLRSAGFLVLKAPDVPSVLIELGFLSSAEDEKKLTSATWRKKTADALAKAVDRHFKDTVAAASP
jgi:N-acetylmuramoyl-L-alanine amidase